MGCFPHLLTKVHTLCPLPLPLIDAGAQEVRGSGLQHAPHSETQLGSARQTDCYSRRYPFSNGDLRDSASVLYNYLEARLCWAPVAADSCCSFASSQPHRAPLLSRFLGKTCGTSSARSCMEVGPFRARSCHDLSFQKVTLWMTGTGGCARSILPTSCRRDCN